MPKDEMNLGIGPSLEGRLEQAAKGRVVVIDAFRSWQCGTWIGDLTVEWWLQPPGGEYVRLAELEGVSVFAHRRLVRILAAAGPTLARSRLPLFGGLRIDLARPSLWIDYLDHPPVWIPAPAAKPAS